MTKVRSQVNSYRIVCLLLFDCRFGDKCRLIKRCHEDFGGHSNCVCFDCCGHYRQNDSSVLTRVNRKFVSLSSDCDAVNLTSMNSCAALSLEVKMRLLFRELSS